MCSTRIESDTDQLVWGLLRAGAEADGGQVVKDPSSEDNIKYGYIMQNILYSQVAEDLLLKDPSWEASYLDRGERMLLRDKNHGLSLLFPSTLSPSLFLPSSLSLSLPVSPPPLPSLS